MNVSDTSSQLYPGCPTGRSRKVTWFDGPQIRILIRDDQFVAKIDALKKKAWKSFMAVVRNFLRNNKAIS